MTPEGSEHSGSRREGHNESKEDYDPEELQKMIDEYRKENEEQEREEAEAPEQHESNNESSEKRELSEGPDQSVRDAIKELEEAERRKAYEEIEERTQQKEESLERSREERLENADKDNLDEFKKKVLDEFEKRGLDPNELERRWRERFVEEVEEELKESESGTEQDEDEKDDEHSSRWKTPDGYSYYTDESGQMYVVKTESKEGTETESDLESESEGSLENPEVQSTREKHNETESQDEAVEAQSESKETKQELEEPSEGQEVANEDNDRLEKVTHEQSVTEVEDPQKEGRTRKPESEHHEERNEDSKEKQQEDIMKQVLSETSEKTVPRQEEKQTQEKTTSPKIQEKTSEETDEKGEESETRTSSTEDTSRKKLEDSEPSPMFPEGMPTSWSMFPEEKQKETEQSWDEYVDKKWEELTEEEKEEFKKRIRSELHDKEDLEDLLKRHERENLLDDEEIMEEASYYLEFRSRLDEEIETGTEVDSAIEQIADDLEIDLEKARKWAQNEDIPKELHGLLARETQWQWHQRLRFIAEMDYPTSLDEFDESLELEERKVVETWLEIRKMRNRCEVDFIVRDGKELYSLGHIKDLSFKYGIQEKEILGWLRGTRLPSSVRHMIFRSEQRGSEFDELVKGLHFDMGFSAIEIARKLGVAETTVYRALRRLGWEPSRIVSRKLVDISEVYRLYYDEGLTKEQTAEKIGVSLSTIERLFQDYGFRGRRIARREEIDEKEVFRLHFEERLSRKEVAEKLGVSERTISRIYRDEGWEARGQTKYQNENERELARRENRKNTQMKVVELREKLFGTKCQICTVERKIAIHRKDGSEHNPDDLWRISNLRTVNPDEYAAVCIPCHQGVHWMMSEYGQNWNQIKSQALMKPQSEPKIREPLDLPDETVPSSQAYMRIRQRFEGSEEELRRALFGEKCHFCGSRYDEKQLFLHRKDGRPHHSNLTTKEIFFRTLDPKEWVFLCYNDHCGVHWVMKTLCLEWDDLKRKEDGAEGEI